MDAGRGTVSVRALEAPDLVWHVAAAMRDDDAQTPEFIERAAEHQVRNHDHLVERETDSVEKLVTLHPALGRAFIRVRENETAELLDCFQQRAEPGVGELL